MSSPSRTRPVWVEVDVAAIRHNARVLANLVAPASLCAVVKADGYGHGALAVARAALDGGARWLAVATVDEGMALRAGAVRAPILVLSEPPPGAWAAAWQAGLTPTIYSETGVAAARAAVGQRAGTRSVDTEQALGAKPAVRGTAADHKAATEPAGGRRVAAEQRAASEPTSPWTVHLKVDTGMHRVGADPEDLDALVTAVRDAPELTLGGLWTHLAVADGASEEDRAFTDGQLRRFDAALGRTASDGEPRLLRHAANSAGALSYPAARYDMVRCGIALYGVAPSDALDHEVRALGLRRALTWRGQVSHVRLLPAGARPSYGRVRPLPAPSAVATVPVGYADGLSRRYFEAGGTVLIGGRHRSLAGVVTMDQILVDCERDVPAVGDEVVLLGEQGAASLCAADWAHTLGTIAYEVLCAIGPRVPRVVVDSDARLAAGVGTEQEGG